MMQLTKKGIDALSYKVIGCAIEVHNHIGPGLLEGVYEKCLAREFMLRNLNFKQQIDVPVKYKGLELETKLRLDFIVEDILCVELKAVEAINPIYEATILSYMHLLQKPKGIILNFNCRNIYKSGQRTYVNHIYANLPTY